MRTFALSVLALGFGIVGIQLTACSNSADDCNATASCEAAAAGSSGKAGGGAANDGGNGTGGTPPTGGSNNPTGGSNGEAGNGGGGPGDCKEDLSTDAACWTTNELGVFVSIDAGSDDTGNGTLEAPFASITKGIASSAGKNVYVCRGEEDSYDEQIILDGNVNDGIHIYAGFDCADWSYDASRTVDVKSPTPIALRILDVKQGAVIENIRFYAANGTAEDVSSYGAFITNSEKVVLRRVELTAGAGMKGADGAAGEKGTDGAASGAAPVGSKAREEEAKVAGGKWPMPNSCGSRGGAGGTGDKSTAPALPGGPGIPTENVHPLDKIANGGVGHSNDGDILDGKVGTSGDAGDVGKAAASRGGFTVNGFSPAGGSSGSLGYPGQGGGGGGAAKGNANFYGASGGAGGMGGCGGTEGGGGSGGGASIGLFSWDSGISLVSSTISGAVGGAGGNGGNAGGGGAGAGGGAGGDEDGVSLIAGGQGGKGGTGGPGGSGSGGTGGPSYALAFSGTKPLYTDGDTMLIAGMGGDAGDGGTVADVAAPAGTPGDSTGEFEIK